MNSHIKLVLHKNLLKSLHEDFLALCWSDEHAIWNTSDKQRHSWKSRDFPVLRLLTFWLLSAVKCDRECCHQWCFSTYYKHNNQMDSTDQTKHVIFSVQTNLCDSWVFPDTSFPFSSLFRTLCTWTKTISLQHSRLVCDNLSPFLKDGSICVETMFLFVWVSCKNISVFVS